MINPDNLAGGQPVTPPAPVAPTCLDCWKRRRFGPLRAMIRARLRAVLALVGEMIRAIDSSGD